MSIKSLDRLCAAVMFILVCALLLHGCVTAWEKDGFAEPAYDLREKIPVSAIYDYSDIEADFLQGFSDYELYDSSVLTREILQNRECLVIERCVGTVTDAATGDGRLLNSSDPEYDYIAYRFCGIPLKDGEVILTYLFYGPEGCDVDDITARYDFVIAE